MHASRRFCSARFASSGLRVLVVGLFLAWTLRVGAQGSFTLLHSLFDPSTNGQPHAEQGSSVAMEGNIAVVGSPFDSTLGEESGVVKLYDTTTGGLLHVLVNPSPARNDNFGFSVAVSGMRVVVGAPGDSTGALNAGSAYVYDLASATPGAPVLTLTNPTPASYDYFGYSVAIFGTRVVVGAEGDDAGRNDAGSAYVFDLASATPTVAMLTLTNPAPGSLRQFGFSAAISGARVVVGAPENFPSPFVGVGGSAYVYDLTAATPAVPALTLTNPTPANGDYFGNSVAISGPRVVIGAPFDDTAAPDAGSAYVYDLGSATPTIPATTLSVPNARLGDSFGVSVAISGTRVVVGAYQEDTAAPSAGSAYVFDLTSAKPNLPVFTVANPSPAIFDFFGRAVAIDGTHVLVGAPEDDSAATDAGSAYMYDLSSATPVTPEGVFGVATPVAGDSFGVSVASSGKRVVVGAWLEDTGGEDAGSVYIYDLASATPNVPVLNLHNPNPGEQFFGWSVGMSGTRIVVGTAMGHSVYVYDMASATPAMPLVMLTDPIAESSNRFGSSVAISGTRVVVGAPYADNGVDDVGRAYAYDLASPTPTVPVFTLDNPTVAFGDQFGFSVAISGTRVVVGAPLDNAWAMDAGSASVYDLSTATPNVPVHILTNPNPAAGDEFGWSVAISGTRVMIGAPFDYSGAFPAGRAFMFDLTSATPTLPVVTLEHPMPEDFGRFGWSVTISGTRLVVGATGEPSRTFASGNAYIYDVSSATPNTPVAALANPSPARNDVFGSSVSIDDATVIVGAPSDDTNALDRGAAYIYGIPSPKLRILPASGFATVSWSPPTGSSFVLQYTDSLVNPNWVNAPSGAANPTTVPTTNGSRFYRLSQP